MCGKGSFIGKKTETLLFPTAEILHNVNINSTVPSISSHVLGRFNFLLVIYVWIFGWKRILLSLNVEAMINVSVAL